MIYKLGRLAIDKAAHQVRSMRDDDLAQRLAVLENGYYGWLGITVDVESGAIVATRWFTKLRLWLLSTPLSFIRGQVAILAERYSVEQNSMAATTSQKDFTTHYLKMVERQREFRAFLMEHFPKELAEAEARNLPLLTVAARLLVPSTGKLEEPPARPSAQWPKV